MEQIGIGVTGMIIYHRFKMKRNLIVHHGLNSERPIPVYLSVKPEVYGSSWEGEDLYFDVDVGSETQEWSCIENDAWLLVIGDSSPGDDEVTIRVSENDTGLPREGTVTFSSVSCPDVVITIEQMANPT